MEWCGLCEKYVDERHLGSWRHRRNVRKLHVRNCGVLEACEHARQFDENEAAMEAMWNDDQESLSFEESFHRVGERECVARERVLSECDTKSTA